MLYLYSVVGSYGLVVLPVTLRTNRFNTQTFWMVFTLHLCVYYGSQNKQQLFPYTSLTN